MVKWLEVKIVALERPMLRNALDPNVIYIEDTKLEQFMENAARGGTNNIHTGMASPHRDIRALALIATTVETLMENQAFGATPLTL